MTGPRHPRRGHAVLSVLVSARALQDRIAGQVSAGGVVSRTDDRLHHIGGVTGIVGGGPGAPDGLGAAATVADDVAVGEPSPSRRRRRPWARR